MRVLCVARHQFLSEHLARFFGRLGVDTIPHVGLRVSDDLSSPRGVDAIICEYDLLESLSADVWETHPWLSVYPVIAVSLTRHPGDAHLRDTTGVAGFFYLPTLEPDTARETLAAISRRTLRSLDVQPWLGTSSVAPLH